MASAIALRLLRSLKSKRGSNVLGYRRNKVQEVGRVGSGDELGQVEWG